MNVLACVLVTLFSVAVWIGKIYPESCQRYLYIVAIGEILIIAAAVISSAVHSSAAGTMRYFGMRFNTLLLPSRCFNIAEMPVLMLALYRALLSRLLCEALNTAIESATSAGFWIISA